MPRVFAEGHGCEARQTFPPAAAWAPGFATPRPSSPPPPTHPPTHTHTHAPLCRGLRFHLAPQFRTQPAGDLPLPGGPPPPPPGRLPAPRALDSPGAVLPSTAHTDRKPASVGATFETALGRYHQRQERTLGAQSSRARFKQKTGYGEAGGRRQGPKSSLRPRRPLSYGNGRDGPRAPARLAPPATRPPVPVAAAGTRARGSLPPRRPAPGIKYS